MSLDYPTYEQLRRDKKTAGVIMWRVGDLMYYLGLLPGVIAAVIVPIGLIQGLIGKGWGTLVTSASICAICLLTFCAGSILKGFAHQIAKKPPSPPAA